MNRPRSRSDRSAVVGGPAAPAPDRAELRRSVERLGFADRRRFRRRIDRCRNAEDRVKLAEAIAAATATVERRRLRVPAPTYPDDLPITARRDELLEVIRANQIVIVAGETGSGKSTQLPKLLLEAGCGVTGLIGHTQPRRVAARTIAQRIAEELDTEPGDLVGHSVRFDDRVGTDTLVKVMTDGILLNELHHDRLLSRYDAIVIDEAHERSLNIDFLLGYLKQLLPERPDLKVVVTSATIDTERFSAHFEDAPVVSVSGRTHPVEIRYRPFGQLVEADEGDDVIDDDRDQIDAIGDAVAELLREGPGDILVFLSGEREIHDTADALDDRFGPNTEILPLYARLSAAEQQRVFRSHRRRRIVLATNVAETSLTVPGVRYVIDAGTARISRYSHRLKVQRLPIERVSRASADQRAGRCGRLGPGICIRLYDEEDFLSRDEFTDPEIQRTNLASVILRMLDLGLGDVAAFPFLDPPDHRSIRDGILLLEELGAIRTGGTGRRGRRSTDAGSRSPDGSRTGTDAGSRSPDGRPTGADGDRSLTRLGRRLVRLPIDPRLGRMVLEAESRGAVREVIIIAAALSIQDPRERPAEKRQIADEHHRRFRVPGSDLLSYLKLWDHLEERRQQLSGNRFRRECRAEFLNHLRIREWRDLVRQVERAARTLHIDIPDGDGASRAHPDHIHRSLLAGLLSHLGMKEREGREFRGARNARFQLAPDSALARKPPDWVMVAELTETNRLWGRRAATIDPTWAEDLAGELVKRSHGEPRWDARSGRAVTDEQVTLHGLPLVTGRRVGYDRVDVHEARDLFVDHALVRREWESRHGFLTENADFLVEVRELADKLRITEPLDENGLFRFYDRRVPDDIVSGRHFDRWWKKERRTDPDLLTLTFDDLAEDGLRVRPEDHPDTWVKNGIRLPVTYRFEPGAELDGVTVHIPLAVLDRIDPWDFDWQVPGLRDELVEALVATLPKTIRRELTPLATTVDRLLPRITFRDSELVEVIADELTEMTGVRVRAGDFDPTRLPPHLRITFAVSDDEQILAIGKDLEAVRELVGGRTRIAVARVFEDVERRGSTRWDVGDLSSTVRGETADGHEVIGYPALLDEGESVAIKVFSRPEIADRVHRSGVRRLVLLNTAVGVRALARQIPTSTRLSLAAFDGLTPGTLLRDVINAAANRIIDVQVRKHGPIRTEEAFDRLLERIRTEIRPLATELLETAGRVVTEGSGAAARIDVLRASPADGVTGGHLHASLDDAEAHLGRLVRPGFVASAGSERLAELPRYVAALVRRLEKLPESPLRDQRELKPVIALEHRYGQLLDALTPSQLSTRVTDVGWQLEELRVATFAQSLGARAGATVKRIRNEIDRLFSGDLD